MSQSEQRILKIATASEPSEGRMLLCFSLDLASGAKQIEVSQSRDKVSGIRAIYVNNESNKDVVAVVDSSKQMLEFPASTQTYLPVVGSLPMRIMFTPAGVPNKAVEAILLNYELPFALGVSQ